MTESSSQGASSAGSTHGPVSGDGAAAVVPDERVSIIPDELVSIIPEDLVRGVWNTARTFITLINQVSAAKGFRGGGEYGCRC